MRSLLCCFVLSLFSCSAVGKQFERVDIPVEDIRVTAEMVDRVISVADVDRNGRIQGAYEGSLLATAMLAEIVKMYAPTPEQDDM